MKRKLAAAVLGIIASVSLTSSARAQGRIIFENYGYDTFARVNYGPNTGGTVGTGVNDTFTAGLWYFLGTATLGVGTGTDSLPTNWEQASVTQQFDSGAAQGQVGLFVGPIATISDYVSGPITFAVTAYNGTAYGSPTTTAQGHSPGFTLSSIATGSSQAGEFGPGLASFSVLPVPEPSMFSLSSIGAAALVVYRRKK